MGVEIPQWIRNALSYLAIEIPAFDDDALAAGYVRSRELSAEVRESRQRAEIAVRLLNATADRGESRALSMEAVREVARLEGEITRRLDDLGGTAQQLAKLQQDCELRLLATVGALVLPAAAMGGLLLASRFRVGPSAETVTALLRWMSAAGLGWKVLASRMAMLEAIAALAVDVGTQGWQELWGHRANDTVADWDVASTVFAPVEGGIEGAVGAVFGAGAGGFVGRLFGKFVLGKWALPLRVTLGLVTGALGGVLASGLASAAGSAGRGVWDIATHQPGDPPAPTIPQILQRALQDGVHGAWQGAVFGALPGAFGAMRGHGAPGGGSAVDASGSTPRPDTGGAAPPSYLGEQGLTHSREETRPRGSFFEGDVGLPPWRASAARLPEGDGHFDPFDGAGGKAGSQSSHEGSAEGGASQRDAAASTEDEPTQDGQGFIRSTKDTPREVASAEASQPHHELPSVDPGAAVRAWATGVLERSHPLVEAVQRDFARYQRVAGGELDLHAQLVEHLRESVKARPQDSDLEHLDSFALKTRKSLLDALVENAREGGSGDGLLLHHAGRAWRTESAAHRGDIVGLSQNEFPGVTIDSEILLWELAQDADILAHLEGNDLAAELNVRMVNIDQLPHSMGHHDVSEADIQHLYRERISRAGMPSHVAGMLNFIAQNRGAGMRNVALLLDSYGGFFAENPARFDRLVIGEGIGALNRALDSNLNSRDGLPRTLSRGKLEEWKESFATAYPAEYQEIRRLRANPVQALYRQVADFDDMRAFIQYSAAQGANSPLGRATAALEHAMAETRQHYRNMARREGIAAALADFSTKITRAEQPRRWKKLNREYPGCDVFPLLEADWWSVNPQTFLSELLERPDYVRRVMTAARDIEPESTMRVLQPAYRLERVFSPSDRFELFREAWYASRELVSESEGSNHSAMNPERQSHALNEHERIEVTDSAMQPRDYVAKQRRLRAAERLWPALEEAEQRTRRVLRYQLERLVDDDPIIVERLDHMVAVEKLSPADLGTRISREFNQLLKRKRDEFRAATREDPFFNWLQRNPENGGAYQRFVKEFERFGTLPADLSVWREIYGSEWFLSGGSERSAKPFSVDKRLSLEEAADVVKRSAERSATPEFQIQVDRYAEYFPDALRDYAHEIMSAPRAGRENTAAQMCHQIDIDYVSLLNNNSDALMREAQDVLDFTYGTKTGVLSHQARFLARYCPVLLNDIFWSRGDCSPGFWTMEYRNNPQTTFASRVDQVFSHWIQSVSDMRDWFANPFFADLVKKSDALHSNSPWTSSGVNEPTVREAAFGLEKANWRDAYEAIAKEPLKYEDNPDLVRSLILDNYAQLKKAQEEFSRLMDGSGLPYEERTRVPFLLNRAVDELMKEWSARHPNEVENREALAWEVFSPEFRRLGNSNSSVDWIEFFERAAAERNAAAHDMKLADKQDLWARKFINPAGMDRYSDVELAREILRSYPERALKMTPGAYRRFENRVRNQEPELANKVSKAVQGTRDCLRKRLSNGENLREIFAELERSGFVPATRRKDGPHFTVMPDVDVQRLEELPEQTRDVINTVDEWAVNGELIVKAALEDRKRVDEYLRIAAAFSRDLATRARESGQQLRQALGLDRRHGAEFGE